MQTHNSLSQQCLLVSCPVSFIAVSSYYTKWINSSCSFSISTIRTVSHRFFFCVCVLFTRLDLDLHVSALVPNPFKVRETKKNPPKNMTYVCGHAASAKYMVSHFTEQLEQMNHQAVPLVFKSILAHRHSVSCLICVVHLNRHVKKYVM